MADIRWAVWNCSMIHAQCEIKGMEVTVLAEEEKKKAKDGQRMGKGKLFRKSRIVYLGISVFVVILNISAWNSTLFSDWYIAHIFPVWVNLYGRVTGLFPFSVGEWMLAAGVILVVLAAALGVLWAVIGAAAGVRGISRRRKAGLEGERAELTDIAEGSCAEQAGLTAAEGSGRQRIFGGFRRFSRGFGYFFVWTVLVVCLIMTLNCFILYHASTFSEHYFGEDTGEYTLAELIEVYNMVAERCNDLAGQIERDENGMAVYNGSVGKGGGLLDMEDMARELMRQLGEKYPQLDGYYPRPKALLSSDFMCQQHMQGYYFPFSMEANYNDVMHILNIPSSMCHELAHLRGYIYEDEANFIGYLACVQSDDAFFQYAGYLSVLTYLNNDLYKAYREEPEAFAEAASVLVPAVVDEQVWTDNVFVVQEEWDRINAKALIDTEVVDKAADLFIDTNLKVNGVQDGKVSYSRVVRLLLQYYCPAASRQTGKTE